MRNGFFAAIPVALLGAVLVHGQEFKLVNASEPASSTPLPSGTVGAARPGRTQSPTALPRPHHPFLTLRGQGKGWRPYLHQRRLLALVDYQVPGIGALGYGRHSRGRWTTRSDGNDRFVRRPARGHGHGQWFSHRGRRLDHRRWLAARRAGWVYPSATRRLVQRSCKRDHRPFRCWLSHSSAATPAPKMR